MIFKRYGLIAHRGLHDRARGVPENSLPAFECAVAGGYAIELDIHLTKDGQAVVFHDDTLMRMTGKSVNIKDRTYAELQTLALDGTNCRIPLFQDVLTYVGGRVPLLIELKNKGFPGALEQTFIRLIRGYRGPYIVESFNPLTIWWLRRHAPQIIRGQLACMEYDGMRPGLRTFILSRMLFNCIARPHFISYRLSDITERLSKKCRRQRIPLLCWTVRKKDEFDKARRLCDGAIFEQIRPTLRSF